MLDDALSGLTAPPPSQSPCVSDTREYRVERCDPTTCRAPLFSRCHELTGLRAARRWDSLVCKKCLQDRPIDQYCRSALRSPGNRVYVCEPCRTAAQRAMGRRQYHKEKERAV